MVPLTRFPRRVPTASKRRLHALVARPALSWSSASLSPLHARLPSPSTLWLRLSTRSIHQCPPARWTPSSLVSSSANVTADDEAFLHGERPDDWFTTSRDPRTDRTFPGRDPTSGRLSAIEMPHLATCSRHDVLDYLDNTWALTDALFATVQGPRAFVTPPPHQLRHPLVFYYGHVTSFYVKKLLVAGLLPARVHPAFEALFEVGVDEMRWDDMSKNDRAWPPVAHVLAYRRHVYQLVRTLVETHSGLAPGHDAITDTSPLWALHMALEHERIHLETTSMLMLEMPVAGFHKTSLLPRYHESVHGPQGRVHPPPPTAGIEYPVNELLDVPSTTVVLGKPRACPSFGWDNEYGHRRVTVPACRVSKFLVSNGEFLAFVRDGGYVNASHWSPLGWAWRAFRHTQWPAFWVPDGPSGSHGYKLRLLFDVVPMRWNWPVQVNYHEAQAFCQWKQSQTTTTPNVVYHLTTEPLHQVLRDARDRSEDASRDDILTLQHGTTMAAGTGKNLNWSYLSFSPVDASPPTGAGFHDVFGNAWEWCDDTFAPLPGFRVHPYYDDFSAPCFDGEHHVIMGGSFASSGDNGASKFARYHFRPHFFQHAGFRLVETPVDGVDETS
ncbi:hypothetical protein PsorP6_007378 [Peronosclerospora sorghi]|uniref:Uncharacterized protein n=1 Tax=Peronosclerospora sorghi TaxID=230839 RepID=A0ACC0W6E5_9STRA|nr:hypothetical protein PsorP6_007378 [Peronosclerospora sorghi]